MFGVCRDTMTASGVSTCSEESMQMNGSRLELSYLDVVIERVSVNGVECLNSGGRCALGAILRRDY